VIQEQHVVQKSRYFGVIMKALIRNKSITKVAFLRNELQDECAMYLAELIAHTKTITQIDASVCVMDVAEECHPFSWLIMSPL